MDQLLFSLPYKMLLGLYVSILVILLVYIDYKDAAILSRVSLVELVFIMSYYRTICSHLFGSSVFS